MKIAIYGKQFDVAYYAAVHWAISRLKEEGFELVIHNHFLQYLREHTGLKGDYETFDRFHREPINNAKCLLSIGGDGTLLETVKYVRHNQVPVMGINTGRLGFISSISVEETESVIRALREDRLLHEERSLLEMQIESDVFGDDNVALNEVTVHKQDTSSMITIHIYINGHYLNAYWADGLIVCTPTGSTAYSLACGGPIVIPGSENFVITPIAPHNLTARPVVVSNNVDIVMRVEGRASNYLISLDSRSASIPSGTELTLRKSASSIHLLHPADTHFFDTIRNKLAWGLDQRN